MSLYWAAIYITVITLAAAIVVFAVLRVSLRSRTRIGLHDAVSSPVTRGSAELGAEMGLPAYSELKEGRDRTVRKSGVRTRTNPSHAVSLDDGDVAQANTALERRHKVKAESMAPLRSQVVPTNAVPRHYSKAKRTISVSPDPGLGTSSLTSVETEELTIEAAPMKSQMDAANSVVPKETESNKARSVFAPVEEDDAGLSQLAGSLEDADVGGLLDFTEKVSGKLKD